MEYQCPYCGHNTIILDSNAETHDERIAIDADRLAEQDYLWVSYNAIACPNPKCKKLVLDVFLKETGRDMNMNKCAGKTRQSWNLMPESQAKPQPNYIPIQIVGDYTEACRISSLSPKASATLSRRCIQGIIRDYWGICKGTLNEEIKELEDKVDSDTWSTIDAIRSVGNIGAHMEKDVNLIIDIEPNEADLLIKLIEDLLEEWYVTRHDRQERNKQIRELANSKMQMRKK